MERRTFITSSSNPRLKAIRRLRRGRDHTFLVEGFRQVSCALEAGVSHSGASAGPRALAGDRRGRAWTLRLPGSRAERSSFRIDLEPRSPGRRRRRRRALVDRRRLAAPPARPVRSRRRGDRAARQPRNDRPQRVRGRGRCPGRRRRLDRSLPSRDRSRLRRDAVQAASRDGHHGRDDRVAWRAAPPRRRCDARGGPAVLGGCAGRAGRCRRRQRALRPQRARGGSPPTRR